MVPADAEQHPDVGVLHRRGGAVPRCRIAVGGRQQLQVGMGELQPVASERQQPIQRRRVGAQWRGTEHESLLHDAFVLVEQHHHQPGPVAEPAEQRALAYAGRGGDVVHGDRVGAVFGDQSARRIEQQCAVAGRVTALVRRGNGQVTNRVDGAHRFTVASSEQNGPWSG